MRMPLAGNAQIHDLVCYPRPTGTISTTGYWVDQMKIHHLHSGESSILASKVPVV
jgi:hypothetical protein